MHAMLAVAVAFILILAGVKLTFAQADTGSVKSGSVGDWSRAHLPPSVQASSKPSNVRGFALCGPRRCIRTESGTGTLE